ncbi:MAG TPA: pitrilysin family protein [Vicinamibacterales bacterium]|nr:pitrilysin family protein [Vicinamibacterales bacterium]
MRRTLRPLVLVLLTAALVEAQRADSIVLREASSPFVAVNVWVKSGSTGDPKGKEGLASLTGSLIAAGATAHDSYDAILQKQYPLAAGYAVTVDKEMTTITGRVHRDNLDAYYALFKNALLAPAFAEADFARLKAQRLNSLERARRYSRDEELSKQLLFWMAYEGTPYAHPEEGYVDSVRSITLDDVRAFYRTHVRRGNVTVAIGGGFPDGFPEKVRGDLDTLPEGAPPAVAVPAPKQPVGVKVLLVDKETDASSISFGFPIALLRKDPDFVPLLVANSYLGEHRNPVGRLYQVIREARGMNYGNYSYIEAFPAGYATQQPRVNVARRSQLFEIWIRPVALTAPGNLHDRTLFALRAARRELTQLREQGLPPAAVAASKQFLRDYVGTWGDTLGRRLGYAVDDAFYGMPAPGFLASLRGAIERVTPEQVNAAIRTHLRTDGMYLVIVTADAARLKEKLVRGEASSITYTSPPGPALAADDQVIGAVPLGVRESDVTILPIDRVFQ